MLRPSDSDTRVTRGCARQQQTTSAQLSSNFRISGVFGTSWALVVIRLGGGEVVKHRRACAHWRNAILAVQLGKYSFFPRRVAFSLCLVLFFGCALQGSPPKRLRNRVHIVQCRLRRASCVDPILSGDGALGDAQPQFDARICARIRRRHKLRAFRSERSSSRGRAAPPSSGGEGGSRGSSRASIVGSSCGRGAALGHG